MSGVSGGVDVGVTVVALFGKYFLGRGYCKTYALGKY